MFHLRAEGAWYPYLLFKKKEVRFFRKARVDLNDALDFYNSRIHITATLDNWYSNRNTAFRDLPKDDRYRRIHKVLGVSFLDSKRLRQIMKIF